MPGGKGMNESFRLLEGLDLERLTAEQAIQEVERIAEKTLPDMAAVYYLERMEAIAVLARRAALRIGERKGSG